MLNLIISTIISILTIFNTLALVTIIDKLDISISDIFFEDEDEDVGD